MDENKSLDVSFEEILKQMSGKVPSEDLPWFSDQMVKTRDYVANLETEHTELQEQFDAKTKELDDLRNEFIVRNFGPQTPEDVPTEPEVEEMADEDEEEEDEYTVDDLMADFENGFEDDEPEEDEEEAEDEYENKEE